MSYRRHHAVVAVAPSGYLDQLCPAVEAFRDQLPPNWRQLVVGPVPTAVENQHSWVFLPDGSGEGFAESDRGDALRAEFAALFAFRYPEDGSSPYEVAEVSFGDYREYLQPPRAVDPRTPSDVEACRTEPS